MAAKPDTAYLYVIGTSDGPVKIGHSLAPQRRLDDFRREGREVVLTGTWPLGRSIALAVERYVHWQLRERHIRGEWFNVPRPEVLSAIRLALSKINEIDGRYPIPALDRHGPKIRFAEHMKARFAEGTFARMDAVRDDGEDRTDFIREAVERELKRRERRN
ncbi:hypothetical protein ABIF07_001035 [Bradyrhizobium elkanii]|uniref:GIY-YIG nuclease family protein n=1 Tax=Bradyrhizobium elkanii TaxID=29448 RepID=UPI00216796DE|nr:GIY-YIG nuclease family protein [Bradyrhizobium elkanii]MCS3692049.1 hypothetical protein [Bradyrhizobium elkanii]